MQPASPRPKSTSRAAKRLMNQPRRIQIRIWAAYLARPPEASSTCCPGCFRPRDESWRRSAQKQRTERAVLCKANAKGSEGETRRRRAFVPGRTCLARWRAAAKAEDWLKFCCGGATAEYSVILYHQRDLRTHKHKMETPAYRAHKTALSPDRCQLRENWSHCGATRAGKLLGEKVPTVIFLHPAGLIMHTYISSPTCSPVKFRIRIRLLCETSWFQNNELVLSDCREK